MAKYLMLCLFLILPGWVVTSAQEAAPPIDLLIVDETKTLQFSLLVNLLAARIESTGLFEIEAVFPTVSSSFDDPLGVNRSGRRYEMILVIPRALEQGTLNQIWIVTCPITQATPPELLGGFQISEKLLQEVEQVRIEAVTVNDDAVPGFFATLFQGNGWLRCE